MKWIVQHTCLRLALGHPWLILAGVGILLAGALTLALTLGRNFLPPFNEGSATITLAAAPGTSLAQANELGEAGARLLLQIPEVRSVGRRAGRAERDDHVMPVSVNEFDVEFHREGRPRNEVFDDIRRRLAALPGTFVLVGQPLAHRLSHMMSGTTARIAVKIFGPDLEVLRELGRKVETVARSVPGLTDIQLERQVPLPQLRIQVRPDAAARYGIQPGRLNEQVSSLVGGHRLAELRDGPLTVPLMVRLPEVWRNSPAKLEELPLEAPGGRRIPLRLVADVRPATGPNAIQRENGQRRLVVGANPRGGDLATVVQALQKEIQQDVTLPEGYYLRFEGEYQAQQSANRRIWMLFALVMAFMLVLLTGHFHSTSLALQVLVNIPLALIGAVGLTWVMVGNLSLATIIGFIAVGGVAARNGIMMLSHYLHLVEHEGESFGPDLIVRGTLERVVPVLMTALSAGIALVPLLFAAHEPGTELLHPIAVVIVGGLASSTLLDLLVTPAAFSLFGQNAVRRLSSAPHSRTLTPSIT
jgi:Cu/Ag efflux pump CusA